MNHLFLFEQYASLNESKLQFQSKFLSILKEITTSSNAVVAEVAELLLTHDELHSSKFKDALYSIETNVDDIISMGKQRIKLGRLLVSFLPDVPLFKIEQFVQVYKSILNDTASKYRVELYAEEEILMGYATKNYAPNHSGDLYSSCMNDDAEYLELYTKNENVSLGVCINKDNRICARTIVWSCNNNKHYYDRIYSITAEHKEALAKGLKAKGIEPVPNDTLYVELEHVPDLFPYVDTFRYLTDEDPNDSYLSNISGNEQKVLDQTDGGCSDGSNDYGDVEYEDDISMREKESAIVDHIEQNISKAIKYLINENCTTLHDIVWDLLTETKNPEDVKSAILYKMRNELVSMQYSSNEKLDFVKDYIVEFMEGDEKLTAHINDYQLKPTNYNGVYNFKLVVKVGGYRMMEELVEFVVDRLIEENGLVKAVLSINEAQGGYGAIEEVLLASNDLHTIATTFKEYMGSADVYQYYNIFIRSSGFR